MTKEQIDKLKFLFERRTEIETFIDCDSNICRIKFGDDFAVSNDEILWESIKMIHAEDFKQDVIALARKYMASIDIQIENVIKGVK